MARVVKVTEADRSRRDNAVRLAIGSVALAVLVMAIVFVYGRSRVSNNRFDRVMLCVLVGFTGGTLFNLVDPHARQNFAYRRIINLSGTAATSVALIMVVYWLVQNTPIDMPVARKVILLDSPFDMSIYDENRQKKGGTNSDDIKSILCTIPDLNLSARRCNAGWSDHQELLDEAPDLIVMHYSSFRNAEGSNNYEGVLQTFLQQMAPSERTRFLIYSRQFDSNNLAAKRATLEKFDDGLKGRVEVFPVPRDGSFADPETGGKLKVVVQRLLGPAKNR